MATKRLKELAANEVSRMLEGIHTETEVMMFDYLEESKIAKGWLQMQDMSSNRLQLMLFHEV